MVYKLDNKIWFPHPSNADNDGLLAFGGDLSLKRLILAYSNAIFPWYSEDSPILWWSPDPRFVLFPKKIKISSSMKKFIKKSNFNVTFDTAFKDVIDNCGKLREEDGTWILPEMKKAYYNLHLKGLAHSVEVWNGDKLVGGLYGVSIGKCFFGESMFSIESNASKFGFIKLTEYLIKNNFIIIDCQVYTKHLESLGAESISRIQFLEIISKGFEFQTMQYKWTYE